MESRKINGSALALCMGAPSSMHIRVLGANREFVLAALERLVGHQLRDFLGIGLFPESLIQQLRVIFPEKWAYLRRDQLQTLIQSARKIAEQHALLAEEAVALFTVLLFFLGHEVDRDPTVPWVEATLREVALLEPLVRIEQLESRTWAELRAVLATNQGRRNHGLG
jgi:hypothetical protein